MAAAASSLPVSVEDYLHTVYKPDVDFVDGTLEERHLGEIDHWRVQRSLLQALIPGESQHGYFVVQETRLQVSPTRFRVPDTCLMRQEDLPERILTRAPLLCIEVMSPEDRLPRLVQKCHEYLAMGVPTVWILDPIRRAAHILGSDSSLTEVRSGTLDLVDPPVCLSLQAAFSGLKPIPGSR